MYRLQIIDLSAVNKTHKKHYGTNNDYKLQYWLLWQETDTQYTYEQEKKNSYTKVIKSIIILKKKMWKLFGAVLMSEIERVWFNFRIAAIASRVS